ncbi:MAG: right-handed parallel beta-helix repeat-containing protein [Thermoclostridium sp.]|nr:right-handed parallel beta-helix repeat-containing protein [Thermoclostridium sp.]
MNKRVFRLISSLCICMMVLAYLPIKGFADASPSAPENLRLTQVSGAQADIAWDAPANPVSGYHVYRDGTRIGTTNKTAYSDSAAEPATTYTYTVTAYGTVPVESAHSSGLEVITGQEYYVSPSGNDTSGNGSFENPWKTINFGFNILEPGDKLILRSGVYGPETYPGYGDVGDGNGNKCMGIPLQKKGTATKPYVIENHTGERPVLDQGYQGTGFNTAWGTAYVTIRGLEIRNCMWWGVGQQGNKTAEGVIVENCYIHHIRVHRGNNGGSVRPDKWEGGIIRNNYFAFSRMLNNEGVEVMNNNACNIILYDADNLTIAYNYFSDAYNAVYFKRPSSKESPVGTFFHHNIIDGIECFYGVAGAGSRPQVNQYNYCNLYLNTGIEFKSYETIPQSGPLFVYNNIFHNGYIRFNQPKDISFYNNIFYKQTSNRFCPAIMEYNNMSGYSYKVGLTLWDYNNYYQQNYFSFNFDSSTEQRFNTLDDWKSAMQTKYNSTMESHSKAEDPLFIDAENPDVLKRSYALSEQSCAAGSGKDGQNMGVYPSGNTTGNDRLGPDWSLPDIDLPAAPVVSGITNGQTYTTDVSPTWADVKGTTSSAALSKNGESAVSYTKGTAITENGSYTLVVTATKTVNELTASTTVHFIISKPQTPVINEPNWPLKVLSWDINKAYPGVNYEYRLGIQGGKYPYSFKLVTAPAGMKIHQNTGLITWNPEAESENNSVSIEITDQNGNKITHTYTLDVTKSDFCFVAPNGNDSNPGTEGSPWATLEHAIKSATNSKYIYVKEGTYPVNMAIGNNDCGKLLAYPEHEATLVGRFSLRGTGDYIFQGFNLDTNSNRWFFSVDCGYLANLIVRKNDMFNIDDESMENPAFLFFWDSSKKPIQGEEHYKNIIVQENMFHDLRNPNFHGASATLYDVQDMIYEDNIAYDIDGCGVNDKDDGFRNTFRNNRFYACKYAISLANQYSQGSIDVSHNLVYDCDCAIRIGSQPGYLKDVYVHHNTFIGSIFFGSVLSKNPDCSNINIYNNIVGNGVAYPYQFSPMKVMDGETAYHYEYPTYVQEPSDETVRFDRNLIWAKSENDVSGYSWGIPKMSLTDWHHALYDLSGILANPGLDAQYSLAGTSEFFGSYGRDNEFVELLNAQSPQVPGIPTGMTANAISDTAISLGWSASSGATGYKIYRDNILIASQAGLSYSDTDLSPATPYSYSVAAYNKAGTSETCASVSATTKPGSTPTTSPSPTPTLSPGPTPTTNPEPTPTTKPEAIPITTPSQTLPTTQAPTPTRAPSPTPTVTPITDSTGESINSIPPAEDLITTDYPEMVRLLEHLYKNADIRDNRLNPTYGAMMKREQIINLTTGYQENLRGLAKLAFYDIRGDEWYASHIPLSVYRKFIKGFPDRTFKGSNLVTRAEVLTMLARFNSSEGLIRQKAEQDVQTWIRFAEQIGNDWYTHYVVAAKDGLVYPDLYTKQTILQPMTRGEVIYALANFLWGEDIREGGKYHNIAVANETPAFNDTMKTITISNPDAGNIGPKSYSWYKQLVLAAENPKAGVPMDFYPAIICLKNKGILLGNNGDSKWQDPITRAEVLALFERLAKVWGEE